MMQKRSIALTLVVVLAGVSAVVLGPRAVAQSAPLPKPGFHHIHMNSPNPSAAIDTLLKWYPATTKATVGGFEGLKTENGVHMLFTKVNTPTGIQGPDRASTAPLTAFWHHVWSHKDARNLIKSMRAADPKFPGFACEMRRVRSASAAAVVPAFAASIARTTSALGAVEITVIASRSAS